MRRISLALALVGAVAATGCGGGAKKSSDSGAAPGMKDGTFTVTVQNGQDGNTSLAILGGTVTSTPPGISCGVGLPLAGCKATFPVGTAVKLSATPTGDSPEKDQAGNALPYKFQGWAGDCAGWGDCSLAGNADKYVLASFGASLGAHPNWSAGHPGVVVAVPAQDAPALGTDATFTCYACHGGNGQGQAIAPSCGSCHSHWNASKAAWGDHGGWSRACQRCHVNDGFRDFIGVIAAPGETAATADYLTTTQGTNAATATTAACIAAGNCATGAYAYGPLKCNACHAADAQPAKANVVSLTKIRFPSTNEVVADQNTNLCAQCHQARESSSTIDTKIHATTSTYGEDSLLTTTDKTGATVGMGFLNPHYLGAAATLFGSDAAGWVQVTGNIYTATNQHGGQGSCTNCHEPHTGDVNVTANTCGKCHFNEFGNPVASFLELEEARQFGFEGDIDGDGNSIESVKAEIDGLAAKLNAAMVAYSQTVVSPANKITYTDGYPYFMGADGKAYTTFTPRLMRAAVNYKWYKADPGAWAHNPRYAIEVLYDTIADLNVALAPLGKQVANGNRAFDGHFGAAEDPSPYAAMIYHGGSNAVTGEVLPTMGFTSNACYQCHGGNAGLTAYIGGMPAALASIPAGGKVTAIQCSTCHALDGVDMKGLRTDVGTLFFPPQKNGAADAGQVSFTSANVPASFPVCGTCHSGRENGASITKAIAANTDANWVLSVTNPHYLGAAGMMLGDNAKVMYQYTGMAYTANPAFWASGTAGNAPGPHGSPHGGDCVGCHRPKASKHEFGVDLTYCAGCHAGNYALAPIEEEFKAASTELYSAIRAYAVANLDAIKTATTNANATGVCYWNAGVGGGQYYALEVSGVCQNGVAPAGSVPFKSANPKLLKAAFNYLWTQKEPGAWAHNEFYVMQVIYDSIVDLGGTPSFTVLAKTVTDRTVTPPVTSPDTTSPNCLQNRPTTCAP